MKRRITNILSYFSILGVAILIAWSVFLQLQVNELQDFVSSVRPAKKDYNKPQKVDVSMDKLIEGAISVGSDNALITIVKFNSFTCGYCRKASEVLIKIMQEKKYANKIKLVYKHFNRVDIDVTLGQALECGYEQINKFIPVYQSIFNTKLTSIEEVYTIGKEISIKSSKLKNCIESTKYQEKTESDTIMGQNIGITGTPAFIINGELHHGYKNNKAMKAILDKLL